MNATTNAKVGRIEQAVVVRLAVGLVLAVLLFGLAAGTASAQKVGRKAAVNQANSYIAACVQSGGNPEVIEDGSSATPENNEVIVQCADDQGVTTCNFNTNECSFEWWVPLVRHEDSRPEADGVSGAAVAPESGDQTPKAGAPNGAIAGSGEATIAPESSGQGGPVKGAVIAGQSVLGPAANEEQP